MEGHALSVAPRFFGSWKGMILKAIAVDGARTWREIQKASMLENDDLNKALKELFDLKIMSKSGEKYWVEDYELYKDYERYYLENSSTPSKVSPSSLQISPEVRRKMQRYRDYMNEHSQRAKGTVIGFAVIGGLRDDGFDPYSEHFFVEGDDLDRLSKDMINYSKNSVVVVNPYVEKCNLSDKLKEVCNSNRNVLMITRSPSLEKPGKGRDQKRAYHRALVQSGVQIFYNDYVHAKLLLIDSLVAFVSSMNFTSSSSGGKAWEAGVVTWQQGIVNSILEAIKNIIDDPDTKKGLGSK